TFQLLALPVDLRPFEALTLWLALAPRPERKLSRSERAAALQPDRLALERLVAEGEPATLERVAASLRANWRPLGRAYEAELYARGLFGRGRDRVRRTLEWVGAGLLALGAASIAVPIVWHDQFGPWPLLISGALVLAGVGLSALGSAASRRTEAGERAAQAWGAFRRHLRAIARGKPQPEQAELLQANLCYALAFDLGGRWARQLAAAGAKAPDWFHALGREAEAGVVEGAYVALVAAAAASASTAGAAGGAAGAGAAGGGASGAG
ncbi:MAG: DUF2207 domain-containing protein, partial [Anaerolineae bacterium]|nr:DUF2207 domain-containing protein [Anaerolineae bacterium]